MDNAYEKELRLIRAAKAGDRSATEKIVAKYEPLVRNIAFGETRIDTEDLWQELRLSILEGLQEFREEKGIYFGCFIRKKLKWKKWCVIRECKKRDDREIFSLEPVMDMGKEDDYEGRPFSEKLASFLAPLHLTGEEKLILKGIMTGKGGKEMENLLHLAHSTYYKRRKKLFKKLKACGISEIF